MAMGKGELLMWTYNKTLQYPINIKCPDPKLAKVIISQYGGPDGELAASLRYLSQRFGEALRGVQDKLAEKKFYMNNMNYNNR